MIFCLAFSRRSLELLTKYDPSCRDRVSGLAYAACAACFVDDGAGANNDIIAVIAATTSSCCALGFYMRASVPANSVSGTTSEYSVCGVRSATSLGVNADTTPLSVATFEVDGRALISIQTCDRAIIRSRLLRIDGRGIASIVTPRAIICS